MSHHYHIKHGPFEVYSQPSNGTHRHARDQEGPNTHEALNNNLHKGPPGFVKRNRFREMRQLGGASLRIAGITLLKTDRSNH